MVKLARSGIFAGCRTFVKARLYTSVPNRAGQTLECGLARVLYDLGSTTARSQGVLAT